MKLKLGFILDPLETLQEAMDTSLLMISEANRRGHHVAFCTLDDLVMDDNVAKAHWTTINYIAGKTDLHHCTGETVYAPLSEFDVVIMRKDPPFDKTYLAATYLLDYAGTVVVNSPRGLREANEKLFPLRWPDFCPRTFVSRDPHEISRFIREERGSWVIKPLDLCGGQKVFRVEADSPYLESAIHSVTLDGSDFPPP